MGTCIASRARVDDPGQRFLVDNLVMGVTVNNESRIGMRIPQ